VVDAVEMMVPKILIHKTPLTSQSTACDTTSYDFSKRLLCVQEFYKFHKTCVALLSGFSVREVILQYVHYFDIFICKQGNHMALITGWE